MGQFACTAAEQNNLDLLKKIVNYGGDVTLPASCGTTALHTAISEGNTEMVKFLLEQGADVDKPDAHGWTPRALADHQGQEEIQALFEYKLELDKKTVLTIPNQKGVPYLVKPIPKYNSEPTIPPCSLSSPRGAVPPIPDISWPDRRRRRRVNNFHNSLAGIMSAANTGKNILTMNFVKYHGYLPCRDLEVLMVKHENHVFHVQHIKNIGRG